MAYHESRFGKLDPTDAEYASVESFIEWKIDNDDLEFDVYELHAVYHNVGGRLSDLRMVIASWGLNFVGREKPQVVRGFKSNDHDRWYGPGSCRTHGGSGAASIVGFASNSCLFGN